MLFILKREKSMADLRIEALEGRRYFSSVKGTQGDDVIKIVATDDSATQFTLVINGVNSGTGFVHDDLQTTATIDALAGNDRIEIDPRIKGRFFIYGGAGNDTIIGCAGKDTLVGQAGDDVLIGGDGNDNLVGSDGNDSLDGGAGTDHLYGEGNILLDNTYGLGRDTIRGGDGNDEAFGGGGIDLIDMGAGNDTAHAGNGNDKVFGATGDDSLFGEDGNDYMEGSAGNDSLSGGANKDTLLGNGGNDTVNGNGGNDVLYGGPDDADRVIGGSGFDYAANDVKDSFSTVETLLN
jgi:Ca2+-binding RTX toxin-like protein